MLKSIRIILFLVFFLTSAKIIWACEICGCALSRPDQQMNNKPWFVEYVFEQQNWHKRDVSYAFDLGQNGHDTHDKTTEDFHHYLLGAHVGEKILITAEIPYVVRRALNVEDPDHLGDHQRSQGWGDLQATGEYDFVKKHNQTIGLLTGVKFPTGTTKEKNTEGEQFEPEMQPGSGSYDYLWGGVYHQIWNQWMLSANAVYTLKTTGAADFRFGNSFSTTADLDYLINPLSQKVRIKPGVQMNYTHEARQIDHGEKVEDSGADTIFLGPILSLDLSKNSTIFSSFQSPIYQHTGGVHQELNWTWTVGGKVSW